jgi:hypothetical protein
VKTSDLKTYEQHHFTTNMICKLPEKEQSADQQSTENTRRDQPSNLIPHDKDHAGDPMSFVPIFHSESTRINNLPTTRRTSPEEEERIQQSNVMKITTPQT